MGEVVVDDGGILMTAADGGLTTICADSLCTLGIRRLAPTMNDGFAFERSTRALFGFLPSGLGARPYLLDTGEEQIAAMFLVEWHRIGITQSGGLNPGSDQNSTV